MNNQFTWRGRGLHLSLNPKRLSITLEADAHPHVYNFDLEGRPWNIYKDGRINLRGLDGKFVAKWTSPQSGRGRHWLPYAEAKALLQDASDLAASISSDIHAGRLGVNLSENIRLLRVLEAAASFASERAEQEAVRFHEIYSTVGILPPDHYQAVLLQATEGCSFNACTFCEFYKGIPFNIKNVESFKSHARSVRDFLGEGLSLRRTIFLGDANALVIPTDRMLQLMRAAGEIFDIDNLGGFYAFLDGFSAEKKSKHEYQQLRAAGLERVYIGLESGHDALLKVLNKPGHASEALDAVHKMKAGGVPVGIIIMLGAGGEKYARRHVEDTAKLLNEMNLDMNDQIYFSELIEAESMSYAQAAFRSDVEPLTGSDIPQQADEIQHRLKFDTRRGTPHISRYDIREFVY